jgi:hypothetical protein
MLGVGPQWVHLSQNGRVTNSIAGEGAGHRNEVRLARCSVYPTQLLPSSASRTLSFPEMRPCAGSYHLPVQHPTTP